MPLPRFAKLPKERRDRILSAARSEFAEHGYQSASFNRVIANLEISKGAMYYYFSDKLDLYLAVVDQELDRFEQEVLRLGPLTSVDCESFWRELEARACAVEESEREKELEHAFAATLYQSAEGTSRLREWLTLRVNTLLDAGRARSAIRQDLNPTLVTSMLVGLLLGVDRYVLMTFPDVPEISPQVIRSCRRLIGNS